MIGYFIYQAWTLLLIWLRSGPKMSSCSWGWRRRAIMPNRLWLTVLCCIFYATPHLLSIPSLCRNAGSLRPEVINMDVFNADWKPKRCFFVCSMLSGFWGCRPKPKTFIYRAEVSQQCVGTYWNFSKNIKFKHYKTTTLSNFLIVIVRATMSHFCSFTARVRIVGPLLCSSHSNWTV